MKKSILLLTIIFIALNSIAQFSKEMGPALTMDNSLGTILMDLSTTNKEVLMKGESDKNDATKRYYPARLFGAYGVYISKTNDEESMFKGLQDSSTMGQIYAIFTLNGDMNSMLKGLQSNIEKSNVYNKFFKINTNNTDPNRVEYVQSNPFTLPNNSLPPTDLAKYNKGLKENFEQYEIRISVEKGNTNYMGTKYEYPQIRSWVQIKPIENLAFDLPDYLPTIHTNDAVNEQKNCLQYVNEIKKQQAAYEKVKKDYAAKKKYVDGVDKEALRNGYIYLRKEAVAILALLNYVKDAPKFDEDNNIKILAYANFASAAGILNSVNTKKVIETFTFKF